MISRVRLQRKFSTKSKFSYSETAFLILRTQIVFELTTIIITCLLNFSLDFQLSQIFTCEFWNTPQTVKYNLALFVSSVSLCPYLILKQKVKVKIVPDCYFSCLLVHSLVSLCYSQSVELDFVVFLVLMGSGVSFCAKYLAMILEQRQLIREINFIESSDKTDESHRIMMREEELEFDG